MVVNKFGRHVSSHAFPYVGSQHKFGYFYSRDYQKNYKTIEDSITELKELLEKTRQEDITTIKDVFNKLWPSKPYVPENKNESPYFIMDVQNRIIRNVGDGKWSVDAIAKKDVDNRVLLMKKNCEEWARDTSQKLENYLKERQSIIRQLLEVLRVMNLNIEGLYIALNLQKQIVKVQLPKAPSDIKFSSSLNE